MKHCMPTMGFLCASRKQRRYSDSTLLCKPESLIPESRTAERCRRKPQKNIFKPIQSVPRLPAVTTAPTTAVALGLNRLFV